MPLSEPHDSNRHDELAHLLEAIGDGTLADSDAEELCRRLRVDPDFRRRYLRLAAFYGHLRMEGALAGDAEEGQVPLPISAASARSQAAGHARPRTIAGITAVAALVIVVLLVRGARSPDLGRLAEADLGTSAVPVERNQQAGTVSAVDIQAPRAPAARFTSSVNVRWAGAAARWSVGDVLYEGDTVCLDDGRVELVFDSGAVMSLVGPAALDVESKLRVTLHSGTATTRVENLSGGEFLVLTPTAEVLDLGTEFGVRVNPGGQETDVVVFDGAVDLTSLADDAGHSRHSRRLSEGEAMRVNDAGIWARLVSVDSDSFPFGERMLEIRRSRPCVIADVSDNLSSEASPKFYTIVPGGFKEDARAFVDRPHEWNGIDEKGLPPELVGGDYIRTFMEDKFFPEMEITVRLAGPAHLYVLYDDRGPVPAWLATNFEDTGLDVGMDEGDFIAPNRALIRQTQAIGAGRSIDNRFSVWKRLVRDDRSVRLGPVVLRPEPKTRLSIYGIVAVHLPEEP